MFPGVDTHSADFGRLDFGGNLWCRGSTATLLAGTHAEWELLEDGLALVLTAFVLVAEGHRLGLDSLLDYAARSRTWLRYLPV